MAKISTGIGAELKTIGQQLPALIKAIGEFTKLASAQKSLGDSTGKTTKSLKEMGSGLDSSKDKIKKVADVLGQIRAIGSDAFAGVSKSIKGLAGGDVKSGIEGIVDGLAAISTTLDLVVPGLGQATSALIKFAGSGVGLLYDLAARTVEENQKVLELRNAFDALGSNIGNTGEDFRKFFDGLADQLPQTRAKLAEMSRPLLEAGVQGDQLERSLRAQSAAMAMLGERGGQAYVSLATRARDAQRNYQPLSVTLQDILKTGVNTKDLAAQMGVSQEQLNAQIRFGTFNAKMFGDALDEALKKKGEKASRGLLNTLGTIIPKMTEQIGMLFQYGDKESSKGLDHFGESLTQFSSLFDQSTTGGKMLHDTLHDLFENVLSKAGDAIVDVRIGFKMLEVVWHTVRHAALPLRKAIKPIGKELSKLADTVGKSGFPMKLFSTYLSMIGSMAGSAAKQLGNLVDVATSLLAITNQITSKGKSGIGGEISGMMLGGMGGALPGHASGGVVTGVHAGLATVQAAPGEGLASIGRGERIVSANNAGGRRSVVIHVEPGAVQINGASGGGHIIELTEEALSMVFERINLKQGFAQ